MTITNVPHNNDDESSAIFGGVGNSDLFFIGDYEHNQEVLETLNVDSMRDEVDEDRLIYAATKKFANANRESPIHVVVSSSELHGNGHEEPNHSDGRQITTRSGMRGTFFRIFERDNGFFEVSREEIQRVRVMHKRFLEGSQFSFNYIVLLIIASVIAALGLGGNSTATIIASMLVSPLMGPVMGMAYAATIEDHKMFRIAFVTELVSLLSCIGVGVVVSGCMIPFFDMPEEWPTFEQQSRAEMRNFWIGIPVAFSSGLGVAVSVLDEQTSSLVGVAISASLLPPAINAGMLWTTSFFYDKDNAMPHNFGVEGLISLCLTLVNILMIIIASMIMFRVKEVSILPLLDVIFK